MKVLNYNLKFKNLKWVSEGSPMYYFDLTSTVDI